MELRHLRYFVVVAEEQNVTRAARRLHVSQPPLSRQIRDLEQELGVALFQRTARSLVLTEAGRIFLIEARIVLLRVDQAVQTVQALAAGDRGRLRIGYAPSLTMDVLPRALREFEQRWPGVRVTLHDLSSEECLQRLAAGRIDLALTVPPGAARRRGLTFVRVKNYPPCCAVPARHPLARKRAIRLQDLRDRKFVVLSQEDYPEYRGWLQALFAPAGFDPRIALECDSATGLIAAVEAGRGIAIVPSSYACVASPRVRLLPFVPPPAPVVLGALSTRPPAPWAEPFIAVLRSSV